MSDQISSKEYTAPFTGPKNLKAQIIKPLKGRPEKGMQSADLFGPLKGVCP